MTLTSALTYSEHENSTFYYHGLFIVTVFITLNFFILNYPFILYALIFMICCLVVEC